MISRICGTGFAMNAVFRVAGKLQSFFKNMQTSGIYSRSGSFMEDLMNRTKQLNVIFGRLFLTILVTLTVFVAAFAADGDLDLSFNGTGKVSTNVGDASDYAMASAIQSDGKIVVAGYTEGYTTGFALARYNRDGSLDNTFNFEGKVVTEFDDPDLANQYSNVEAYSVAIQDDGKIVVAGEGGYQSHGGSLLARYNSDGSLDLTFDEDGIAFIDAIGVGRSVAIQADGKIIAAGRADLPDETHKHRIVWAIVRLNNDGSLDKSFNNGGIVKTPESSPYAASAKSAVLQADGKILVYGSSGNEAAIRRYNTDGSLDMFFGTDGKIAFGQQLYGNGASAIAQADGKILALGETQLKLAAFRFNADGSPDNSFGKNGVTLLGRVPTTDSFSAKTQSDGKTVIVFADVDFARVIRLESNGSFDSSFGLNGIVTTYFPCYLQQVSLSIQSDSKPVTTQSCRFSSSSLTDVDFEVSRYNADGSLDNSFDLDGRVTTGDFGGGSGLNAMAAQPDGKIVAVGSGDVGYDMNYRPMRDFAVVRYNTNGTLDTSFDGDGKVATPVGSLRISYANSVAVQSDGKIVAAGVGCNTSNSYIDRCGFAIVRYNSDGSLDNSFDGDGQLITEIPGRHNGILKSIVIQPDGKIVAAGTTVSFTASQTIIRYNSDGSLDTTFGSNGIVIESSWQVVSLSSLAIQSDGSLITVGKLSTITDPGTSPDVSVAVAKYHADGSPDTSFGSNGKVLTPFESYGEVTSVKVQTDGKVIVGGSVRTGSYDSAECIVLRYDPNGVLDPTFAKDGILKIGFFQYDRITSIAIQSDGKIVAAGYSLSSGNTPRLIVARINPDGILDESFDGDGKLTLFYRKCIASSVLIQKDGRIVIGGTIGYRYAFGLIRLQGTPVSQNAGIGGRITTASGRGIANVSVQISGGNLTEPKYARTNSLGYYRFQTLAIGQTYVISISSKRYSFTKPTRVITLNGNLDGEDFVSEGR